MLRQHCLQQPCVSAANSSSTICDQKLLPSGVAEGLNNKAKVTATRTGRE
jgi:hypothetical protein